MSEIRGAVGPGRERVRESRHPAGQVATQLKMPPIGANAPWPSGSSSSQRTAVAPVAAGELGRVELGRLVAGAAQAERAEHLRADGAGVVAAGDSLDDPAEHGVAEVGVVEDGARRPGRPDRSAGQQRAELGRVEALLPVAPRVVGREARRHRQQVPDGDRRAVRRRQPQPRQFRHVAGRGIVQAERPAVAQQHDHRRGEALGHRRDAEHGASVGNRAAGPAFAEATGMRQAAVGHHSVGQARLAAAGREPLRDGVDCAGIQRFRIKLHAGQPSWPAPPRATPRRRRRRAGPAAGSRS